MKRSMFGKVAVVALSAVIALGIGSLFGKDAKAAGSVNEAEPNNTIPQAQAIATGNQYYGEIMEGDMDYYKLVVPSSGRVKFTVYGNFTLKFYIFDSTENEIAHTGAYSWEKWGERRLDYDFTQGTYYIRITGGSDTPCGSYNFYYSFESANESFAETGNGTNNTVSQASAIKTDVDYRGQFSLTDGIDYYKLVMDEPGKLNITTTYDEYLYLDVYDVKENNIFSNRYNAWGGEAKNSIYLTKGVYYFEFHPYSGSGVYTFKMVLDAIKFEDSDNTIVCGDSMTLSLANIGNWDVTWKSSNPSIAQVSSDGRVLANKAGAVTIMATCDGKTVSRVLQILYKDVTDKKEFWYEPTNNLTNRGIVQGYEKQTMFMPANNCSRAQMVTFLWRLKGSPDPRSSKTTFKDVKKGAYYYKAVLWAVEKGITTGYSKTSFKPNNVCTRAQTVTFLWRMAGKPTPKTTSNKFKDISKKDYFYKAVLWASEKNIVAGYSNKTFRPQNKCTRRQMVTFLYKYSQNVK